MNCLVFKILKYLVTNSRKYSWHYFLSLLLYLLKVGDQKLFVRCVLFWNTPTRFESVNPAKKAVGCLATVLKCNQGTRQKISQVFKVKGTVQSCKKNSQGTISKSTLFRDKEKKKGASTVFPLLEFRTSQIMLSNKLQNRINMFNVNIATNSYFDKRDALYHCSAIGNKVGDIAHSL